MPKGLIYLIINYTFRNERVSSTLNNGFQQGNYVMIKCILILIHFGFIDAKPKTHKIKAKVAPMGQMIRSPLSSMISQNRFQKTKKGKQDHSGYQYL